MTITYKRALITTTIFGFLFLFLTVYFIIVGPQAFLDNKVHFVVNSIALALSMIGYALTMIITNKVKAVIDERDYFVQKKSFGVGLVLTLLYVFSLSIILFIINQNTGSINVTWLWFIGYSTFAFSYFITSLVILYYYNRE